MPLDMVLEPVSTINHKYDWKFMLFWVNKFFFFWVLTSLCIKNNEENYDL